MIGRSSALFPVFDIDETRFLERLAHLIEIEAEHARGELLPLGPFVGHAGFSRPQGRLDLAARHPSTPSSSATIASPGLTSAPAQTTGMLTEPSVALTVPLARLPGPDREAHARQRLHIAHAGIDDEAHDTVRREGCCEEIAEHAVGVVGGHSDDENVARPALFDATWIIQLSPGCARTVTALPAICAPAQMGRI